MYSKKTKLLSATRIYFRQGSFKNSDFYMMAAVKCYKLYFKLTLNIIFTLTSIFIYIFHIFFDFNDTRIYKTLIARTILRIEETY